MIVSPLVYHHRNFPNGYYQEKISMNELIF